MKLYRASGHPIDPAHRDAATQELNKAMDAIESELGKCTSENAKDYQKKLEKVSNEFPRKYPNEVKINYPRTKREIKALCEKYGSVAFCVEDASLVAYILDK